MKITLHFNSSPRGLVNDLIDFRLGITSVFNVQKEVFHHEFYKVHREFSKAFQMYLSSFWIIGRHDYLSVLVFYNFLSETMLYFPDFFYELSATFPLLWYQVLQFIESVFVALSINHCWLLLWFLSPVLWSVTKARCEPHHLDVDYSAFMYNLPSMHFCLLFLAVFLEPYLVKGRTRWSFGIY